MQCIKLEECQSHFPIFPSLVMQQISSFIHYFFKKNAYAQLVFFNQVTYMQILDMISRVNIIGRKVSIASINGPGGSGGIPEPHEGF